MWLLKLHFSISVLCMITVIGFAKICGEQFRENGWGGEGKKKKSIFHYLAFFVPIMNVIMVILLFVMLSVKKNDFDKMCEEAKKDRE